MCGYLDKCLQCKLLGNPELSFALVTTKAVEMAERKDFLGESNGSTHVPLATDVPDYQKCNHRCLSVVLVVDQPIH